MAAPTANGQSASLQTASDELLALDCRDLTFSFKEGDEPVLEDVNLQLKRGDRCLLIGANGGQWRMYPFDRC